MKALVSARLGVPFWCSFRMPYTANVSFTYPVPPPITLYGFIGSALGLPADSYDLVEEIQINVGLEQRGEIVETYSRIIKRDSRIPDLRTLLVRQKLHQPEYRLYVLAEDSLAQRIVAGLKNPVYPLYLGESDDLVEVDQVEIYPESKLATSCVHSVVPADLGVKPVDATETAYLPVAFKAKAGKRDWAGVEYRTYYLGTAFNLDGEVQAWQAGNRLVVF